MGRAIIRMGDPTSHGGQVIEGSFTDFVEGKPVAYFGHMVSCPSCKGSFPIIEGAPVTMFYGKGVALDGMKTSCGATLIATQFTTTVEYASSASPSVNKSSGGENARGGMGSRVANDTHLNNSNAPAVSEKKSAAYDLHFLVKDDKTGRPLSGIPYKITLETGEQVTGITDANGLTQTIDSDEPVIAKLEVPYYGNGTSNTHTHDEYSACGC